MTEIVEHPWTRTFRARYVFPVTSPPIPDGTVTIRGQRIEAVEPWRPGMAVEDLGNVAIVPGLINAHTHLEFSDLDRPLGERGIAMVDWIRLVMSARGRPGRDLGRAVTAGLQESTRSGITALAEIAQPGWPADLLHAAPLEATVFLELIAPTAARVATSLELGRSHLATASQRTHLGLSPHAPYSVHPHLLKQAVGLSAAKRVPLAFHLAESREELELLGSGTGPLRHFLADLGAWDPEAIPRGPRPLDYLQVLAAAHRALVIHGNYLNEEEIAFLGRHADRMAVVYCPRTHAWFDHADYPLAGMLRAGVTVALGTDSRASSPDLSILAELREAARRHASVAHPVLLELATLRAAKALGREGDMGSLEPGKYADMAVVGLPSHETADPHELLLDRGAQVVGTWHHGQGS